MIQFITHIAGTLVGVAFCVLWIASSIAGAESYFLRFALAAWTLVILFAAGVIFGRESIRPDATLIRLDKENNAYLQHIVGCEHARIKVIKR